MLTMQTRAVLVEARIGRQIPGAGLTGGCEPANMDAGNTHTFENWEQSFLGGVTL